MGEDPSVIREEIAQTRQRVGDEVDALSYKTDVGARVGDYVDEKKQAVKSKLTGVRETGSSVGSKLGDATSSVTDSVPDRQRVGRGMAHLRDTAASNPVGLAIGGIAAGFVIGTIMPRTRIEDERLGDMSDRLMDAAKSTAGEAVDRGKQVAGEAVGAAVDVARESGRQQGEELAATLQERAQPE
jgi:hypothetical protein